MNIKPLSVIIVILAVIAVIIGGLSSSKDKKIIKETNQPLLDSSTLGKATKIVLNAKIANETIVLQKKDTDWILPDFYSMKVNFEKMESLANDIMEAKIGRVASSNPEKFSTFELGNKVVELYDKDDQLVWKLDIGKDGASSGAFVNINEEEVVYLSNIALFFDNKVEDWVDKKFNDFDPGTVRKVATVVLDPKGKEEVAFEVKRADGSQPFVATTELGEKEVTDHNKFQEIINTLKNAVYTSLEDLTKEEVKSALANTRDIQLTFADDSSMNITVGKSIPPEPKKEKSKKGEEQEKEEEPAPEPEIYMIVEHSDPDHSLNRIAKVKAFKVPDNVYDRMPEKWLDVVKEKEEPKPKGPEPAPATEGETED
ncbi:MAG: DUF4340 domain-containing protein [Verrucomicrobiota bacterium]